jgi:tRNA threonylcarbamoyladenosine biosynthesis protein TsaB
LALILNIDTSSYYCSVALSNNEKIIDHRENNSRNHTQVLLTTIKELLNNSGGNIKGLSAIAVNIGPGSYTGLRVGLATAKGLCYSSGLLFIPVCGLAAIAGYSIKKNKYLAGAYIAVQDNYKNGIYYAVYDEKLNTLLPPACCNNIAEVISRIPGRHIYVCGAMRYDSNDAIAHDAINVLPRVMLSANHLAFISSIILKENKKFDMSTIQPLYINSIFSSL